LELPPGLLHFSFRHNDLFKIKKYISAFCFQLD